MVPHLKGWLIQPLIWYWFVVNNGLIHHLYFFSHWLTLHVSWWPRTDTTFVVHFFYCRFLKQLTLAFVIPILYLGPVHCLDTTQSRPKEIYNCLPIHSQHPPPPPQTHRNTCIQHNISRTGYKYTILHLSKTTSISSSISIPSHITRTRYSNSLTFQQKPTLNQHDILWNGIVFWKHQERTRFRFKKKSNLKAAISLQHFYYSHIARVGQIHLVNKNNIQCPKRDPTRMANKNLTKRG